MTLMARVDLTLANQVKRYASLHRQPISLVIRDALSLLMEEYPAETDRTGSHRLAAHEFLSDRYETPLDTLVGETGTAALEEFVSDKNKAAIAILDADEHSARKYVSDTKEDEDILSDTNRGTEIMSDTKVDEIIVSDTKAVPTDIASDTNSPPYDTRKYVLGEKLCPGKHEWGHTGRSLLSKQGRKCKTCQTEGQRQRREAKRQGAHA